MAIQQAIEPVKEQIHTIKNHVVEEKDKLESKAKSEAKEVGSKLERIKDSSVDAVKESPWFYALATLGVGASLFLAIRYLKRKS